MHAYKHSIYETAFLQKLTNLLFNKKYPLHNIFKDFASGVKNNYQKVYFCLIADNLSGVKIKVLLTATRTFANIFFILYDKKNNGIIKQGFLNSISNQSCTQVILSKTIKSYILHL